MCHEDNFDAISHRNYNEMSSMHGGEGTYNNDSVSQTESEVEDAEAERQDIVKNLPAMNMSMYRQYLIWTAKNTQQVEKVKTGFVDQLKDEKSVETQVKTELGVKDESQELMQASQKSSSLFCPYNSGSEESSSSENEARESPSMPKEGEVPTRQTATNLGKRRFGQPSTMMEEIEKLRAQGMTKASFEPFETTQVQRNMGAGVPIFQEQEIEIEDSDDSYDKNFNSEMRNNDSCLFSSQNSHSLNESSWDNNKHLHQQQPAAKERKQLSIGEMKVLFEQKINARLANFDVANKRQKV